jgi:hypothetical protein
MFAKLGNTLTNFMMIGTGALYSASSILLILAHICWTNEPERRPWKQWHPLDDVDQSRQCRDLHWDDLAVVGLEELLDPRQWRRQQLVALPLPTL